MNGSYLGHAYRESRMILEPGSGPEWSGSYFVLEETLRDTRAEARRLDSSGEAKVAIGAFGAFDERSPAPLPSLRGLLDLSRSSYRRGLPDEPQPLSPQPDVSKQFPLGSSFVAPGLRRVDLRDASYSLGFLAEYRVASRGSYANRPALQIKGKFATRLHLPQGALKEASGSHDLDIWLDLESGLPLFIRDLFDETFGFSDGGRERRSGSSLVFWKGGDSMRRGALIASLGGSLGAATGGGQSKEPEGPGTTAVATTTTLPPADSTVVLSAGPGPVERDEGDLLAAPSPELAASLAREGLELAQGDAGVVLKIFGLQFKADSDELLVGEKGRLDIVSRALASAPAERNFLVEGHAASAGKPKGELDLSQKRAKRIVDELVARGLPPSRFIYRGLGSTKPIAPNDSEAGKARNRRVEITILD